MRRRVQALAAIGIVPLGLLAIGTRSVAADATAPKSGAELAQAFGAREYIEHISLSPDGTKIAMVVPNKDRGDALIIGNIANGGETKTILTASGDPDHLERCQWSTDTRLICSILFTTKVTDSYLSTAALSSTRIVSLNADGGGLKQISAATTSRSIGFAQDGGTLIDWGGGGTGSALVERTFVPESATGNLAANTREGYGVELVDTTTLSRKVIEQPRPGAVDYVSDGRGNVRIMGLRNTDNAGYNGNRINYFYRAKGDRTWLPLTSVVITGDFTSGFRPYAVDPDKNVAYGFEKQNGYYGLYSLSLDGNLTKTPLLERSDVDVDELVVIGRNSRVIGGAFVTDRRETEFFDPELKALRTALSKALPGRLITFVDSSADESKLLLFAGSDTDPGRYYLFDRKTRSLGEIIPTRNGLDGIALATVKPITYQAADGTSIPAYLTLPVGSNGKNLPAIVMPHGGPGTRDEWGFDWLSQFFAARGFAVIQPNYRGSAGYGDGWYRKNGFQSWQTAIGDVNDAGRWLVKSGIADPKKLAIIGWSYGGYAALQSSVLDADLFKAIIAIAPVTDLDVLRDEKRDFTNFPQVDAFIGKGPWIALGSPARNAAKIKAPVLLFHGDRDQTVGIGESRLMADRLKSAGGKVEFIEFKGLGHQLDDGTARAAMLSRADAFLRTSLGMAP